jgi:hypothetical protein
MCKFCGYAIFVRCEKTQQRFNEQVIGWYWHCFVRVLSW